MVGRAAETLEALRDRGIEVLLGGLFLEGIARGAKAESESGGWPGN